jgi:mono/diheme cytochrome c family protein
MAHSVKTMINVIRFFLTTILMLFFLFFSGCDYARMKEQEAIQTYGEEIPQMPEKTIPTRGGLQVLKETDPEKLKNPLPPDPLCLQRGKEGYANYCTMCHGLKGDGKGTVGQSFYPLPADLKALPVQRKSDGRLFFILTFGSGRHPALGFMLTEEERWAIIHYVRSLKKG